MDQDRNEKMREKIAQISAKIKSLEQNSSGQNLSEATIIKHLETKKRKLTSKINRKIKKPGVHKVNFSQFQIIQNLKKSKSMLVQEIIFGLV